MNAIPRAVWTVLGVVLLVLAGLGWLHLHDTRVREMAQAHVTISAKDDTIRTLHADIVSLGKAIKAADSVMLRVKGTVTRVAYVPPELRDSIARLNFALDSIGGSGGTTVPIGVARQYQRQLNACTLARDQAVAGAMIEESACETATKLRDQKIDSLTKIEKLMQDKLAITTKLAGFSQPRLVPFVDLNRSFARKSWEGDAGAKLRLFAQFHLQASARVGENLGSDSIGALDTLPVMKRRHWDALVGGHYEFH